ncbi:hypothetical protein UVI_02034510 [Ustilaginoidea virens]|uniref:Guanyl-nucleotide exchange factor n=1 Tax=Ustilaginoidea virens TaxID=1159556 RepID=A0A1B5L8N1_USTVR|nr:hypothetical protein UVI_02034510 [Ustilaginoidea virens]
MAIRKLLMEAELPKETQQIDRCLQAFANRYHECNPGIYSSPDQAYFIAFSLLILHTDVFNKNNKRKMQKSDYLKNTRGEDAMHLEDHYNYLGTAPCFNLKDLQNTFFRTGVLQIVSARSRPDAFMSEQTASNPDDAHPGIVDIKVTKVGLLWRKDAKKRKTRSPWQEWGAILTGAQLYFFRNISWVKNLMHQHENHLRSGHDGIPVIFKPPLEEFKPDSLMSTHAAVALVDSTYRKHKNAFVYVRQEGLDEVLLADNEEERNDWLAKLNYAAAFRTSGVRMRGVVGANYDGQGRRGIRRLESADTSHLIQTPTGPVSIARGYIDHKMAEDIQAARRDCMQQKIREADKKVEESQKQLEEQLRNARHLLILAPIQPRTREHILLAAARLSAQLKWTRMDIWREKCHRDILIQDLADDDICSTIKQPDLDSEESTQTPRRLVSQTDCKPDSAPVPNLNPQTPTEDSLSRASSFVGLAPDLAPSVLTASQLPQSSTMETARVMSNATNTRNGSVSSNTPSFVSHILASTSQCNTSREGDKTFSGGRSDNQDDVDADERDFLKQAGLWEGRSRRSSVDKSKVSSSAEMLEYGPPAERDKLERNKIRRSLQRTLRESAGHLSHHRSKRGRDASASTSNSLDGATGETFLSRGTGSFVVHGKKASVINLGTELQTLSQEEKILCRKQQQTLQVEQPIVSRLLVDELDEAFHAAPETPFESNNSNSRRSSGAIAGTATVDSFKKPDKNKLRFQGAKSASRGGPIVASGPDSEDASCSSDGQRPSQPRTDREDKFGIGKASTDDEMPYETEGRREDEPGENDNLAEEEGKSEQEHDVIPSHPTQAVTA